VKPISEAIIKRHLGTGMSVKRGWFGKWKFSDRAQGWKGYVDRKGVALSKHPPEADEASYLPFARIVCDLFCAESHAPEIDDIATAHLARAFYLEAKWRLRRLWTPLLRKDEKSITKGRLVWHFDKLGLKSIRRRLLGGFVLRMKSGRKIILTQRGYNFQKSQETLLPGEEEGYPESVRWETYLIYQDVLGGFCFPSLDGQALLDGAEAVEAVGFTVKDDRVRVMRYFGVDAKVKRGVSGFKVVMPNGGYVKFSGGAIEKVCGDLLRPALRMFHDIAPDKVVVRGKADLVLFAVQEGRALGISVIPESDLKTFFACAVMGSLLACGLIAGLWLDFLPSVLAGFVGGMALLTLGALVFNRQLQAMARRKGLEMVGFDSERTSRSASIDEARKKGML
jgi:hypothetical protein